MKFMYMKFMYTLMESLDSSATSIAVPTRMAQPKQKTNQVNNAISPDAAVHRNLNGDDCCKCHHQHLNGLGLHHSLLTTMPVCFTCATAAFGALGHSAFGMHLLGQSILDSSVNLKLIRQ
jgi:hypothetical protein